MKQCKYCGKEYPDEVTVCSLDGKPVETASSTRAVSGVASFSTPRKVVPRPKNLTATCWFIVIYPIIMALGRVYWGSDSVASQHVAPAIPPELSLFFMVATVIAVWVAAVAMLKGLEWGRGLYVASVIAQIILSLLGGIQPSIIGGLVVQGIVLLFLYDAKVTAFFRQIDTFRDELRAALEQACQSQQVSLVKRGRQEILSMPREAVLQDIERVASDSLALDKEYEFRRLLELYEHLDRGLLQRLVERHLRGDSAEIRAAAEEFKGKI